MKRAVRPRKHIAISLIVAPIAVATLGGCDSCDRIVNHFSKKGLRQAEKPVSRTPDDDRAALVGGPAAAEAPVDAAPKMAIQCTEQGRPVSSTIFGIAFADADLALNASAYRWGGNTTSRYNFRLNAWNTGSDWFWQNVPVDSTDMFLGKVGNRAGVAAITVPIMGWVAKDTASASFLVSVAGAQEKTDPDHPDFGNGKKADGTLLTTDPSRTSVAFTPADLTAWIKTMKAADDKRGAQRLIREYILDNEPMLWNSTHRDVHPEPTTYDELLQKTIAFGSAIRAADPTAVIAGPASWGWPAYFFSAADTKAGYSKKPDRAAHGDTPFLAWYLRELKKYRDKTGVRVLDVLDVHFYPQGEGVQQLDGPDNAGGGSTDTATNEVRIRSTRALWDCTYIDESWISEPQCLIPRMKEIIAQNDPGLKFQIGEWNFGAETHPSGGVALAEAFGRMAELGVDSAYYWTYPKKDSPAYWAFRAYRNYDGQGGHFLEQLVPTHAPAGTSLYASRDATGKKLVVVGINFSPDATKTATIAMNGCAPAAKVKAWEADSTAKGLQPLDVTSSAEGLSVSMRPYSVVVMEISGT